MNGEEKPQEHYNNAFPTLGGAAPAPKMTTGLAAPRSFLSMSAQPKIRGALAAEVTKRVNIPKSERRQQGKSPAAMNEIRQEVSAVQAASKAKIQFSVNKDDSLNIIVKGKTGQVVDNAIKLLKGKLAEQGKMELKIPKEFHKFILGRQGKTLQAIEQQSGTNIRVPGPSDTSDVVTIKGPKEGIKIAEQKIRQTVRNQASRAVERLDIPKNLHLFIRGANDKRVKEWENSVKNAAKINIPPNNKPEENVIVIQGDKEAVVRLAKLVQECADKKAERVQELQVEIPAHQHKYIIGQRGAGIQEILEKHDVIVDVPKQDSKSTTITLHGEPVNLGAALNDVYIKANSVTTQAIKAPAWIRPKLIGPKGKDINEFQARFPGVQIDLNKDTPDKIELSGPLEKIDAAVNAMKLKIKDILTNFAQQNIVTKPDYFGQIIGAKGANVREIKNKYPGLDIRIPKENNGKTANIMIEGRPEHVREVAMHLQEIVNKLDNQKSVTHNLEAKYHRFMMPFKASLQAKYTDLMVLFPSNDGKQVSNDVVVRGQARDVDEAGKALLKEYKEVVAKNYMFELQVMKSCHRVIIGKKGETITKIRLDCDVQIDVPNNDDDDNRIKVTGKRQNVDKACKQIRAIEAEHMSITEDTIQIDQSVHRQLIGAKGAQVKSLMQELNVYIQFPDSSKASSNVVIRGEADNVKKAKSQLTEVANQKLEESFQMEVKCEPEYVRFIIGKQGANSNKIKEDFGVRLVFPNQKDTAAPIIILGKDANVKKAAAHISSEIKKLSETSEASVQVPKEFHSNFLARGKNGSIVNQITAEFAAQINIPNRNSDSEEFKVKGPSNKIDKIVAKINETVEDLKNQVTVDVELPCNTSALRTVIGQGGSRIIPIEEEFNVSVRFPRKEEQDDAAETVTIQISGNKDKIEDAKAKVLKLVPMTEDYDLSNEFHRLLLGKSGEQIRALTTDFNVTIKVPKAPKDGDDENVPNLNQIKLTGPQENINALKEKLRELRSEWDEKVEDLYLKSYCLQIDIPAMFHSKIIGKGGESVRKIRDQFDVQIQFPDNKNSDKSSDTISITGYKDQAEKAADDIQSMIDVLQSMISKAIEIDNSVHARIIGQRGRGIRKLSGQYSVDIKFPVNPKTEEEERLVTVIGSPDNVERAIEELLNLEAEFLQERGDDDGRVDSRYIPKVAAQECMRDVKKEKRNQGHQKYSAPQGAPWAQSNGDAAGQFPSLANGAAGGDDVANMGVWAGRR